MIGEINKNTLISAYQPSADVIALTNTVKQDYSYGVDILNRPWTELNERSVIEDQNRGQMMLNAFVDTSVEDPAEAWKWRGTRSLARNKAITMHANLTGNYILPSFTALNDDEQIEQDFSDVMHDIIEWMSLPNNSDYQSSFLQIVFGMMSNPVTYLGAEFIEVYQTIRERQLDGSINKKEMLDEVLSGFKAPIWGATEVLITNAYERNIQKQRGIIKRRYVEKEELEARFGEHPNWAYVQAGIKSIYNKSDGLFYDVADEAQRHLLVAEETAMYRRDDTEVTFVNGIYMGDNDSVDDNPICHRDNRGAPKYNVTPFGYYHIGEHFFYYKSMMNAVGWDNNLYDAMSEVVMNRALLETEMPIAISGADNVDSDIIFPNSVVSFESPDTKVTPLIPNSNIGAGFSALQATEKSIASSTLPDLMSGAVPQTSQRAYAIAAAQANAKKIIGDVAKSLTASIIQYGDLMKDIAINHYTLPQVEEMLGGTLKLKYRSFLLEGKQSQGKTINKKIVFDESLLGKSMTPDERKNAHIKLLEENGYPDNQDDLIRVNPELFANFKYLTRCDTEEMFTKNQEYWQPVLSQLYQMLRQDPLVDSQAILRKLMYAYFKGEGDGMVKDQPAQLPGQMGPNGMGMGGGGGGAGPDTDGPGGSQYGQMIQNKALGQISTDVLAH